jgi:hypothetical protein
VACANGKHPYILLSSHNYNRGALIVSVERKRRRRKRGGELLSM